jgi:uncharacterized protein (TIGR04255 family)
MGDVTFRRPPLIEVSFGLRFRRPPALHVAHYGLFWANIVRDFPDTLDQPPIADPQTPPPEWFGPRVWLVHRDKALLLQLQYDRFHVNWRRLTPDVEYPRFTTLAPLFRIYCTAWAEFLDRFGLGRLEDLRAELSYVNHLEPSEGWPKVSDIGRVITPLQADATVGEALPTVVTWGATFELAHTRTSADLKTMMRPENVEKLFQLEIKAESSEPLSSVEEALLWAERANGDIVTTFCSITSNWAQKELWDRGDN